MHDEQTVSRSAYENDGQRRRGRYLVGSKARAVRVCDANVSGNDTFDKLRYSTVVAGIVRIAEAVHSHHQRRR